MALDRFLTGMAYEMRLALQGIYESKDLKEARKLFVNWCAWGRTIRNQTGELLEPRIRVSRLIEGNLAGVLTHWTQEITATFMEGLNSLFSAPKRKAHGHRTVEYMTTMLYFVAERLTRLCHWSAESSEEPG
jgi:hypothetical protein